MKFVHFLRCFIVFILYIHSRVSFYFSAFTFDLAIEDEVEDMTQVSIHQFNMMAYHDENNIAPLYSTDCTQ